MSTFFKIQPYKKPSQYSQYFEAEGEKVNIENNENEIAELENLLLSDSTPQQELADYKSVPFATNAQGKPLHCIHCASWGRGSSTWWYHGVCAVSGASKTNKSKCDLIAYEEIIYG